MPASRPVRSGLLRPAPVLGASRAGLLPEGRHIPAAGGVAAPGSRAGSGLPGGPCPGRAGRSGLGSRRGPLAGGPCARPDKSDRDVKLGSGRRRRADHPEDHGARHPLRERPDGEAHAAAARPAGAVAGARATPAEPDALGHVEGEVEAFEGRRVGILEFAGEDGAHFRFQLGVVKPAAARSLGSCAPGSSPMPEVKVRTPRAQGFGMGASSPRAAMPRLARLSLSSIPRVVICAWASATAAVRSAPVTSPPTARFTRAFASRR